MVYWRATILGIILIGIEIASGLVNLYLPDIRYVICEEFTQVRIWFVKIVYCIAKIIRGYSF